MRLEGLVRKVGEMGLVTGGLLRGLWITAVGGGVKSMAGLGWRH